MKLFSFGPVVHKEMSFKEKDYRKRTKGGRRTKTDHNSSSLASGSGELIT